MKLPQKKYLYQNKTIRLYTQLLFEFIETITYLFSLLFVLGMVYEHGFPVPEDELIILSNFFYVTWIVFLIRTTIRLFWQKEKIEKRSRLIMWILAILLYLTLIPVLLRWIGISETYSWIGTFHDIYREVILLIVSLLQLSYGIIRLLGRRTNPALILASSFIIIIIIGMGLLMLPRSTVGGISWVNALFLATSAVCVTGLTPVDISAVLTGEGQFFIILLAQVGGLGVMTFTSFFALFFMGNTTLYNQIVVRDMINSNSLSSLLNTLFYIFLFTISLELYGMIFIFWDIHGELGMSLQEELAFSAFHAVSGFCNAGFSIYPGGLSNPILVEKLRLFYFVLSFLIILGSIGFPILYNFHRALMSYLKRFYFLLRTGKYEHAHEPHLYNLNTVIVLVATAVLLLLGTIIIGFSEWNNAFHGMAWTDKLLHSFFNATSLRTAGFNSMNVAGFTMQTLLLVVLFMFIGGGAQSTAGGIKVNAFTVVVLNLLSIIRGKDRVEAFGRELTIDSVRRANATMLVFILVLFIAVFILSILEPSLSVSTLVFQCTSALSTAGSGIGVTPILSVPSKFIIIVLMFIGRVGIITLLMGLIQQKQKINYRYPKEEIIIN